MRYEIAKRVLRVRSYCWSTVSFILLSEGNNSFQCKLSPVWGTIHYKEKSSSQLINHVDLRLLIAGLSHSPEVSVWDIIFCWPCNYNWGFHLSFYLVYSSVVVIEAKLVLFMDLYCRCLGFFTWLLKHKLGVRPGELGNNNTLPMNKCLTSIGWINTESM